MDSFSPSENLKIKPICPVYEQCGGCQYQEIPYSEELKLKEQLVHNAFLEELKISSRSLQLICASPQEYFYRNRLDLKVFRNKNKEIFVGFSPQGRKTMVEIDACYIARQEISDLIPEIKKQIFLRLPSDYRMANVVVRSGDDKRVCWGGIGRRSLELPENQYFWTEIRGRRIFYSLDTFFQANLFILSRLISQLEQMPIWGSEAVFYDLYGGVGFFGLMVQPWVGKVILIEQVPASLKLARYNVGYHQLQNFEIYDGKVENVLPSMLNKMSQLKNVLMVDPPRAGLSQDVVAMLNTIEYAQDLLYLSCDLQSLVANCQELMKHWQIVQVMPFDFFPRTAHIETLVWLKRR